MIKKEYIIESKGFTQGIGSSFNKEKNKKRKQEILKQLQELENEKRK